MPARFPASVLALDLGGTQLRTAVAVRDGGLIARRSTHTPRALEDVVRACVAELRASLAAAVEAGTPAPHMLAISAPGPLDPADGVLLDPPNLDHGLWGFGLAAALGDELSLPAALERDTQVAALAEGDFGAGRGLTDYVYLTVSTGIGGGVVSGGQLLRGPDGLAGELGHLTIEMDGPPCGCGARGHLEAISSGTGIARAAREAGMGDLEARDVAAAEERGDSTAAIIMDHARRAFAAAVVSIVDVFNPQRVIVGGGLAAGQGERLLGPAREAVRRHAFARQAARVDIVPAQLGDDVGLIGALSLAALTMPDDDAGRNSRATGSGHPALPAPRAADDDGRAHIERYRVVTAR